ncbi:hypothetical protein F5883DRAFT_233548 [Diaporthe sp. PMI_573]|nr:hypothetical protein F5883DRAFT_233548 [Diaporthaceae sp. PMI_573]
MGGTSRPGLSGSDPFEDQGRQSQQTPLPSGSNPAPFDSDSVDRPQPRLPFPSLSEGAGSSSARSLRNRPILKQQVADRYAEIHSASKGKGPETPRHSRRHQAKQATTVALADLATHGPPTKSRVNDHKLEPIEEHVLVQQIIDQDARGFPMRLSGVEDMANLLLASQ